MKERMHLDVFVFFASSSSSYLSLLKQKESNMEKKHNKQKTFNCKKDESSSCKCQAAVCK